MRSTSQLMLAIFLIIFWAWEYAIWVEGWHQKLFSADGRETGANVRVVTPQTFSIFWAWQTNKKKC